MSKQRMGAFARAVFAAVTLCLSVVRPAAAADDDAFPSRPMRFIVSVGPGTGADLIARTLAEQLSLQFGKPVVVDNRPGADGAVAMQAVMAAAPDGHTLVVISAGSIIMNPMTMPGLSYKLGDIRPLAGCALVTGVFATGAASRFASMKGAFEIAGREPGKVTIGTYGGIYRMAVAGMAKAAGVNLNHVSYKGLAPVTSDLAGGSLDLGLVDAGTSAAMINAGRLRGLAVTSANRLAGLPDVPTLRELGLPPPGIAIWVGTGLHRATPEPLVAKLEQALQKAMASPAWYALLAKLGSLERWPVGSREFAAVVDADTEYFRANLGLLNAAQ